MPIGNESNLTHGQLQNQLGLLAVRVRNDNEDVTQFAQIINQQGTTGLEGLGFSPQDAADFVTATDHLLTVAQVYYGIVAQPVAFNFDGTSDLVRARGAVLE